MSMSPGEQTHLAPGYRLDRYELLCPIGVGGMASVWVARLLGKHGFEKLVAVKTILPAYDSDPTFQQMFLDEGRIAARIHHPNVAQILDLGDHHGVLFLVMEWVEGDALSKLARAVSDAEIPFPPGIAARILIDVCAGLHAAHELRDRSGAALEIVHRDVSPHNILVGAQGVSKVIDFGIAKARDRAAGDTRTGSFKGKIKYMSPEQAVAPKSTDRRADVWAVGAVLYALLSGRSPYESDNDMATLIQLAQQKPPEPLPPEIPQPIRKVVARALAWDPNERYATAAELRDALEGAIASAGIVATNADVAAFTARHLAERVGARERAVALALSAAEERSRVARLLTPEETGSALRPARPSQPRVAPPRSSDSPTEQISGAPGTSPTLVATTSFTLPSPKRRHGVMAALGLVALIGGTIAVVHRADREPSPSAAHGSEPSPLDPSARAAPLVPVAEVPPAASVPVAAAPVPLPPSTESAAAIASPPPTPPPVRRRSPAARPAEPTSRAPATQAPAGTSKRRSDYGF
jgi:eukaryotic-like serine/threonine-protein kinase